MRARNKCKLVSIRNTGNDQISSVVSQQKPLLTLVFLFNLVIYNIDNKQCNDQIAVALTGQTIETIYYICRIKQLRELNSYLSHIH